MVFAVRVPNSAFAVAPIVAVVKARVTGPTSWGAAQHVATFVGGLDLAAFLAICVTTPAGIHLFFIIFAASPTAASSSPR